MFELEMCYLSYLDHDCTVDCAIEWQSNNNSLGQTQWWRKKLFWVEIILYYFELQWLIFCDGSWDSGKQSLLNLRKQSLMDLGKQSLIDSESINSRKYSTKWSEFFRIFSKNVSDLKVIWTILFRDRPGSGVDHIISF